MFLLIEECPHHWGGSTAIRVLWSVSWATFSEGRRQQGARHPVKTVMMMQGLGIKAYKECWEGLGQEQRRPKKNSHLHVSKKLSCEKESDFLRTDCSVRCHSPEPTSLGQSYSEEEFRLLLRSTFYHLKGEKTGLQESEPTTIGPITAQTATSHKS